MRYIIKDWADNRMFPLQDFKSFIDAEEFLIEFFETTKDLTYETDRQEYTIEELNNA